MNSGAIWILFAAGTLLAPAAAAKEHLIEVSWSQAGDFRTDLRIAPGKFKELCVPLKKGERVEWSFSSPVDTAFNIHYHVGSEVSYPAKVDGIRTAQGTLEITIDQDYCWMWKAGTEPAPTDSEPQAAFPTGQVTPALSLHGRRAPNFLRPRPS